MGSQEAQGGEVVYMKPYQSQVQVMAQLRYQTPMLYDHKDLLMAGQDGKKWYPISGKGYWSNWKLARSEGWRWGYFWGLLSGLVVAWLIFLLT